MCNDGIASASAAKRATLKRAAELRCCRNGKDPAPNPQIALDHDASLKNQNAAAAMNQPALNKQR